MIVRVPGLTDSGRTVSDDVGIVDVMPTVLEALGEQVPAYLMGHSFIDRLRGEGEGELRGAASGFMDGWRTLGVGRLKLVQRGLQRMYLYDVIDDPGEQQDVAGERALALRYARGLLGLALAQAQAESAPADIARARAKHARQRTEIDPETAKQLRALGYVQ